MEYIFIVLASEELAKIPKTNSDARLKTIIRELFNYVNEKIC